MQNLKHFRAKIEKKRKKNCCGSITYWRKGNNKAHSCFKYCAKEKVLTKNKKIKNKKRS